MDMDGTILDASYRISPAVSRTLCILQSRGKKLIIATGRVLGAAVRFLEGAFEPDAYVCTNGADIFGPGRMRISSHHLPADGLRMLAGLARRYPLLFCFYIGEQWVYERPTPMVTFYEKRTGIRGIRTDLDLIIEEDVLKCLVLGPHDVLLKVRQEIDAQAGSLLSTVFSHEEMLEVMASGVSKSRGLEECLRFFGGSLDEVIAFGDAENDLDMLMAAGVGVAMGNAPAPVKARVRWIAESVDADGVARFLERLFPQVEDEAKRA
jgi:Cof subfamily protein (haloacid dehalogenase superfamily)